jgi:hypothetical protein
MSEIERRAAEIAAKDIVPELSFSLWLLFEDKDLYDRLVPKWKAYQKRVLTTVADEVLLQNPDGYGGELYPDKANG